MNCEEAKPLVEALHDRNLGPQTEERVEGHLAACPACRAEYEQLRGLSGVLRKSRVPAPSAALGAGLLREFRLEQERRRSRSARKSSWWRGLFAGGPLVIPKPVAAAGAVLIAVALVLSNLMGRGSAPAVGGGRGPEFKDVAAAETDSPAARPAGPPAGETAPETKIVEVPVFRDRVVKQLVYVGRPKPSDRAGINDHPPASARLKPRPREKNRMNVPAPEQNDRELRMNDSIAQNGYFTRADLSAFRPVSEMKTRIIRETKDDEK